MQLCNNKLEMYEFSITQYPLSGWMLGLRGHFRLSGIDCHRFQIQEILYKIESANFGDGCWIYTFMLLASHWGEKMIKALKHLYMECSSIERDIFVPLISCMMCSHNLNFSCFCSEN